MGQYTPYDPGPPDISAEQRGKIIERGFYVDQRGQFRPIEGSRAARAYPQQTPMPLENIGPRWKPWLEKGMNPPRRFYPQQGPSVTYIIPSQGGTTTSTYRSEIEAMIARRRAAVAAAMAAMARLYQNAIEAARAGAGEVPAFIAAQREGGAKAYAEALDRIAQYSKQGQTDLGDYAKQLGAHQPYEESARRIAQQEGLLGSQLSAYKAAFESRMRADEAAQRAYADAFVRSLASMQAREQSRARAAAETAIAREAMQAAASLAAIEAEAQQQSASQLLQEYVAGQMLRRMQDVEQARARIRNRGPDAFEAFRELWNKWGPEVAIAAAEAEGEPKLQEWIKIMRGE